MKLFAVRLVASRSATISAQAPLVITTEPNAIVWIDEIRRGTADASGKLSLTKVSPGRHTVRVRASGFKETSVPLAPGRRTLAVKLVTNHRPGRTPVSTSRDRP